MKKTLFLIAMVLFGFFVSSCDDAALSKPQNIIQTATIIDWDDVADAEGYMIVIGSETLTVAVSEIELDILSSTLPVGTHSMVIFAISGDLISEGSDVFTFVLEAALGSVTNLSLNDMTLTWDAADEAASYHVIIGENTYSTTSTSMDLSILELPYDIYTISVQAVLGTEVSEPSTLTFDYRLGNMEPMEALLRRVNENYSMDMDESDFESEEAYMLYVEAMYGAQSYLNYMSDYSETEAAIMYMDTYDTFDSMQQLNSPFDMFGELALMDYSSEEIARMILATIMSDPWLNESYLTDYEMMLNESYVVLMSDLWELENNPEISAFIFQLEMYGLDYILDPMYSDPWYLDYYINEMFYIARSFSEGYTPNIDISDDFLVMFNEIAENAVLNNDTAFIDVFVGNEDLEMSLYDYTFVLVDLEIIAQELSDIEMSRQQSQMIFSLIGTDEETLIDSLVVYISYVKDVYQAIQVPLNNIETMMASGTATATQIANVKDQVVYAIYESLPEHEVFVEALSGLLLIGYTYTDADITYVLDDAELLVSDFELMMQAFAEFMYFIDASDIQAFLDISGNLESDPYAVVDLAVLGAGILLDYQATYQTTLDDLESAHFALFDLSILDFFGMVTGLPMDEIQGLVFNALSINDVLMLLVNDYMDVFVNTDGALIRTLIDMQSGMYVSIDTVLDEILPYADVTLEDLSVSNLDMIMYALVNAIGTLNMGDMMLDAIETALFNNHTQLATLVNEVLTLVNVSVNTAASIDIETLITSYESYGEAAMMFVLFDVADQIFETPAFDVAYQNILTLLETILSSDSVLTLTGMSAEDVMLMISDIDDAIQIGIIEEINYFTTLDPETMTESDMERITNFMMLINSLFVTTEPIAPYESYVNFIPYTTSLDVNVLDEPIYIDYLIWDITDSGGSTLLSEIRNIYLNPYELYEISFSTEPGHTYLVEVYGYDNQVNYIFDVYFYFYT